MKRLSFILFSVVQITCLNAQLNELRIASFNIRFYNRHETIENQWEKRATSVSNLIKFYDIDIIGIQECMEEHQVEAINKINGYSVVIGEKDNPHAKKNWEYSYRPILYKKNKYEIKQSGHFWINNTDPSKAHKWHGEYRGCTWAEFKTKEQNSISFFVFNGHYTWAYSQDIAKILIYQINKIAGENKNIILTGDFNFNQTSKGYSEIINKFQDSHSIARLHLATNGSTNDFKINGIRRERIDHIFIDSALITDKYSIITDIYYASDSVRFPSDHYPVISVLKQTNSTNTNIDSNKIKICSYNIGGYTTSGPNKWNNRLPIIYKSILLHNVDIIGLQKANMAQLAQLKDSLNYNNSVNYMVIDKSGYAALLYNDKKYKVCEENGIPTIGHFNLTSNENDLENSCTWAKMRDITNSPFDFFIFNGQLIKDSATEQSFCISKLKEKILEIAGSQAVFLTGTYSFDQNSLYYNNLNGLGIVKDAYDLSPIKYNSERSVNNNFSINIVDSLRNDFVFASPHSTPVLHGSPTTLYWTDTNNSPSHVFIDALPINKALEREYNPTSYIDAIPYFSSDHFPVIVEFEVKRRFVDYFSKDDFSDKID